MHKKNGLTFVCVCVCFKEKIIKKKKKKKKSKDSKNHKMKSTKLAEKIESISLICSRNRIPITYLHENREETENLKIPKLETDRKQNQRRTKRNENPSSRMISKQKS